MAYPYQQRLLGATVLQFIRAVSIVAEGPSERAIVAEAITWGFFDGAVCHLAACHARVELADLKAGVEGLATLVGTEEFATQRVSGCVIYVRRLKFVHVFLLPSRHHHRYAVASQALAVTTEEGVRACKLFGPVLDTLVRSDAALRKHAGPLRDYLAFVNRRPLGAATAAPPLAGSV